MMNPFQARNCSLTCGEWNCVGNIFAAAGSAKTICLWSVEDTKGSQGKPLFDFDFTQGGHFVSPSVSSLLSINPIYSLRGHTDAISSISFAFTDAYKILTLSDDGTVRLWDLLKSQSMDEEIIPEYVRERNTRSSKVLKEADGRCVVVFNLTKKISYPPFSSSPDGVVSNVELHPTDR
jgi:WD40 repeat protein